MSFVSLAADYGIAVIWMGGCAQLLGMPAAWLRLRRTAPWRDRPEGRRRIDLLAKVVARPTVWTVLWGWAWITVAALGGLGLTGLEIYLAMFGPPIVFVPWAVARIDAARFLELFEDATREQSV